MTDNAAWSNDPDRDVTDGTSEAAATRVEEEAVVRTEEHDTGRIRVSKHVESETVEQVVPRRIENAELGDRVPAAEGDSGEIEVLEDGSISIPVFEEELVVTKRLVVRERLVVRKTTEIDEHRLSTELRKERVEVSTDGAVELTAPEEDAPATRDLSRGSEPTI